MGDEGGRGGEVVEVSPPHVCWNVLPSPPPPTTLQRRHLIMCLRGGRILSSRMSRRRDVGGTAAEAPLVCVSAGCKCATLDNKRWW